MATEPTAARLAVLIDPDNAPPQIAPGLFEEIAKLGEASVRRIYGNFSGTRLKSWADHLAAHAIIPNQNFANTPGKNASDIALVIDAMDLLHSGRFDGFCLVSSDSDFTRLAARTREQGVSVYGFGEDKTPASFRQVCKRFFFIENLLPPPLLAPPPQPKPPPAPKPPKALPAKPSKPARAEPPETKRARMLLPVQKGLGLLQKAVAQLADDDGWARLDIVGTHMVWLAPDFDTRSYGFSKLSGFVTKSGEFDVRRDTAKDIFIRSHRQGEIPPDYGQEEIPF